jgi:hypothetical protein
MVSGGRRRSGLSWQTLTCASSNRRKRTWGNSKKETSLAEKPYFSAGQLAGMARNVRQLVLGCQSKWVPIEMGPNGVEFVRPGEGN